jgi:hypothetical protein
MKKRPDSSSTLTETFQSERNLAMIRRKRLKSRHRGQQESARPKNKTLFRELLDWFVPQGKLFTKEQFHGNTKWNAEQLVAQAMMWSWQEAKNVTDAFDQTQEVCNYLRMKHIAKSYTSMMNALNQYDNVLIPVLRERHQMLAEQVGGPYFRDGLWVLIGFDGSRAATPRTVSNERAFCAPNYGKGKRAKYGKKKSKGMRRKRNQRNKPHPQAPQAWTTMMWHMRLRLPWTWRLGPSNSSERGHVMEMLQEETFPENTLFCGDAGFVGYSFWSAIMMSGQNFLVRVGANVNLLSEYADTKRRGGGIVLCWPRDKMNSGSPPLRLRLIRVKVGKTKMWMLTSVLDPKELTKKKIIRYYKMRWGIEVEFRGLKQTIDKQKLRCRNSDRLLVELDWSILAMAVAELIALREQIPDESEAAPGAYDPKDRSLANTMRALRQCMRNLNQCPKPGEGIHDRLGRALVQRYKNRTDKGARYRPKNPDKKPLGDPTIRKLNKDDYERLRQIDQRMTAGIAA